MTVVTKPLIAAQRLQPLLPHVPLVSCKASYVIFDTNTLLSPCKTSVILPPSLLSEPISCSPLFDDSNDHKNSASFIYFRLAMDISTTGINVPSGI